MNGLFGEALFVTGGNTAIHSRTHPSMLRIELRGAKVPPTGFSCEVDDPRRPRDDGSEAPALDGGAWGACLGTIWFNGGHERK